MTTVESPAIVIKIPVNITVTIPKYTRNPDAPKKLPETDERVIALKTRYKECVDRMYELSPYRSVVGSARTGIRKPICKQFIAELMNFKPDGTTNPITTPRYISQFGDIYFGLDLKIGTTSAQKHINSAMMMLYNGYDNFKAIYEGNVNMFKERSGRSAHLNTDLMRVDKEVCERKIELLQKIDQIFETAFTEDVKSEITKHKVLHLMVKHLITIKIYGDMNNAYNKAYNDAKNIAKQFDDICRWSEYVYRQVSFRVLPTKDDKPKLFEEIIGILSQSSSGTSEIERFVDACKYFSIEERKCRIDTWRLGSYIDDQDYTKEDTKEEYED